MTLFTSKVEYALRALLDALNRMQGSLRKLVHDLLMKRLLDGQFEESGLTLTELHIIEESLCKGLIALYHSRIKYPEPERKANRARISRDSRFEHRNCRLDGLMKEQLSAEIEDIVFAGFHLRGQLVLRGRGNVVLALLFNFSEDTVHFGGVVHLDQFLKLAASFSELACPLVGERQIEAIVVIAWRELLRAAEVGNGIYYPARVYIELAEIVVRLVVGRL